MDELYIENFSKHRQTPSTKLELQSISKIEIEQTNRPIKSDDLILDMIPLLERLEKEIEKKYPDFLDYRFLMNKIREKIKNKNLEGIVEYLDNLEQLLDVGLPSIDLQS